MPQTADGRWWSLLALLEAVDGASLDLAVRPSRTAQVPTRLIAVRVS
jgi:hypothetical protein